MVYAIFKPLFVSILYRYLPVLLIPYPPPPPPPPTGLISMCGVVCAGEDVRLVQVSRELADRLQLGEILTLRQAQTLTCHPPALSRMRIILADSNK